MARVICLGMAALDAIYRVPAIPVKPVKVIASSFGESGAVGARILRGLADEGADRLSAGFRVRRRRPMQS